MAKPSRGTPKDKRLKANKSTSTPRKAAPDKATPRGSGKAFGGAKAAPFKKGGGRAK